VGKLATMICFDADFTDVVRRLSRQGAQIIANPSLFGRSIAQMPHTQIVFRAIENHTAIVMADVAYNSAIVDPYGRMLKLAITPEGSPVTLIADVHVGAGNTLYSRLGDWPGWLCLVGFVFFVVFMLLTKRASVGRGKRS
jgi:apolipoprotein N-acyltransferase